MIHLVYISNATHPISEEDLKQLLEECRSRNKSQNITGMLLYVDQSFLQILEGEEADVVDIYESIINDERNTGNIVLIKDVIEQRMFPDWTMGFKRIDKENVKEIESYTDILNRQFKSEELSQLSDDVLALLYQFKKSYI